MGLGDILSEANDRKNQTKNEGITEKEKFINDCKNKIILIKKDLPSVLKEHIIGQISKYKDNGLYPLYACLKRNPYDSDIVFPDSKTLVRGEYAIKVSQLVRDRTPGKEGSCMSDDEREEWISLLDSININYSDRSYYTPRGLYFFYTLEEILSLQEFLESEGVNLILYHTKKGITSIFAVWFDELKSLPQRNALPDKFKWSFDSFLSFKFQQRHPTRSTELFEYTDWDLIANLSNIKKRFGCENMFKIVRDFLDCREFTEKRYASDQYTIISNPLVEPELVVWGGSCVDMRIPLPIKNVYKVL